MLRVVFSLLVACSGFLGAMEGLFLLGNLLEGRGYITWNAMCPTGDTMTWLALSALVSLLVAALAYRIASRIVRTHRE